MKATRPLALFMVAMLPVIPAWATPFCVLQTGIPLQCLYNDPGICQQEAESQGGRCVGNPAEFRTPIASGAFCVVESNGAQTCLYPDYSSCQEEADNRGGACVAAIPTAPPSTKGFDPYEVKRPY